MSIDWQYLIDASTPVEEIRRIDVQYEGATLFTFMECPLCFALVAEDRLEQHLQHRHHRKFDASKLGEWVRNR